MQHDAAVFFGGDPLTDPGASYRRFFADVQMYATGPDIDPQGHLSGQRCSQVQAQENNWAGENNSRACNERYEEIFARLVQLPIGAERETLIRELNDILVGNYYAIPLVNRGSVSAHLNSLLGVRINGWDSELWNIAEWSR